MGGISIPAEEVGLVPRRQTSRKGTEACRPGYWLVFWAGGDGVHGFALVEVGR